MLSADKKGIMPIFVLRATDELMNEIFSLERYGQAHPCLYDCFAGCLSGW